MQSFDIVVIGSGGTGLAAAAEAASRGASVACIEASDLFGGLVANVGAIDDFPVVGAPAGASLADTMVIRCRGLGVCFVNDVATGIERGAAALQVSTANGRFGARRVIVATGGRLRKLGVPGEAELAGRGVSQCNWCDGSLFRGEAVVVVGGGDSALQAALHLASVCASVTIVVRGMGLRAKSRYLERAMASESIGFQWGASVVRILGTDAVSGVALKSAEDGTETEIPCAGVFVFAGLESQASFVPDEVARDANGFLVTDADFRTKMEGVLAAGAARSGFLGPLVCAMGEGSAAAVIAAGDIRTMG